MAAIAIFHVGKYGQTCRIAETIEARLREKGHEAVAVDLRQIPPDFQARRYDLFAVGASVHGGVHPKPAVRFVKRNRSLLESRPSAFFSVSMSAAGKQLEEHQQANRYIELFLKETGWQPTRSIAFAGAIRYSRYGLVTRFFMRQISESHGRPTDTSHDYEYTDWKSVLSFADELGRAARKAARKTDHHVHDETAEWNERRAER